MKLQNMNTIGLIPMEKNEMQEIEGGLIPLAVAWGICKIVAVAAAGAYGLCYTIGKFHAHVDNNTKK